MANCYYCSEQVDNADLYPLDDTYVRVCPECKAILNMVGQEYFESQIELFDHDAIRAKQNIIEIFDKNSQKDV